MAGALMDEKVYRKLLDETYASIDRAFEEVDPDLAEVDISQGTLTVLFREKLRFILTPQPSPRQLWVAFKDRAWHFSWDGARRAWLDDRGEGIELIGLVEATTRDAAGVEVRIARAP
jgi:iron donor protein CyaY